MAKEKEYVSAHYIALTMPASLREQRRPLNRV
jgi:hypothetical protein